MNVLIADDDRQLRETLKEVLEDDGFSIVTAQCGEEALYIIRRRPDIQVLISDYVMPDLNGVELIRKARTELYRNDIRCLLMTGRSDEDLLTEIMDLGIDQFMQKPFEMSWFRRQVMTVSRLRIEF
jgi:DNA-binding response OmpR family regulator